LFHGGQRDVLRLEGSVGECLRATCWSCLRPPHGRPRWVRAEAGGWPAPLMSPGLAALRRCGAARTALLLYFAAPVTRHPPPTTTEVFDGPRMPRWWSKRCGGVPCGVK